MLFHSSTHPELADTVLLKFVERPSALYDSYIEVGIWCQDLGVRNTDRCIIDALSEPLRYSIFLQLNRQDVIPIDHSGR
jgi:hypothetical protein